MKTMMILAVSFALSNSAFAGGVFTNGFDFGCWVLDGDVSHRADLIGKMSHTAIGVGIENTSILEDDGDPEIFRLYQEGSHFYELSPVQPEKMPEITSIKLKVDGKSKAIESLTFTDDLDNLTQFKFSQIKFNAKISKSSFKYKPPKDADITDY